MDDALDLPDGPDEPLPAGDLQLRENDENDPVLRSSYLLARANVPENTIKRLEAGLERLNAIRFLPKGSPERRRKELEKAHSGMGHPPPQTFERMLENDFACVDAILGAHINIPIIYDKRTPKDPKSDTDSDCEELLK